jgi:hypothetical protein
VDPEREINYREIEEERGKERQGVGKWKERKEEKESARCHHLRRIISRHKKSALYEESQHL